MTHQISKGSSVEFDNQNGPRSSRESCKVTFVKCLTRTVLTTLSQEADEQRTSETADTSAPVGSDVTEETESSERPVTSQEEPENSSPEREDVQQKVDPGGQLATRGN